MFGERRCNDEEELGSVVFGGAERWWGVLLPTLPAVLLLGRRNRPADNALADFTISRKFDRALWTVTLGLCVNWALHSVDVSPR